MLAPVFAVMIAAALGGHVHPEPARLFRSTRSSPDFSKLSLIAGFKRMFGLDGWPIWSRASPRSLVVGVAIWTQLWPERDMLEVGAEPDADRRRRRHEPSAVQGADRGAGRAGRDRGARLLPAALPLPAAQPHVQAGDQGRVPPERRRPADQGQDPPDPPGARQEAHDGGGAGGHRGHHEPDPLCRRAEIRIGKMAAPDLRRQGRRRAGPAHPRSGRRA